MRRWLDTVRDFSRRVALAARDRERGTGRPTRRLSPPSRLVEHGVRIEYDPVLDGDPDPGEVVWAWVPFAEQPTLGKDRPIVIIGRHGDDLAGVALTTKHKDRDDHIDTGRGPWDRQHRPSYAKVDRLFDIDPDEVRREGGILPRDRFDQVVAAVDERHRIER